MNCSCHIHHDSVWHNQLCVIFSHQKLWQSWQRSYLKPSHHLVFFFLEFEKHSTGRTGLMICSELYWWMVSSWPDQIPHTSIHFWRYNCQSAGQGWFSSLHASYFICCCCLCIWNIIKLEHCCWMWRAAWQRP